MKEGFLYVLYQVLLFTYYCYYYQIKRHCIFGMLL